MSSLISLDRHIIHRETFQGGDQGVRLNPYHRSIPTAMAYGNAGGRIGPYGIFDGANTKIDCGSDFIGTTALSISCWIYLNGWGEGDIGKIIDNGKFIFVATLSAAGIRIYSDGSTYARSATSSIQLNTWYHVVGTRDAAGVTNLYIGTETTPLTLSGSADQDSGTPVAGTTNVIVGNNNAQAQTFDGNIALLEIRDLALTAAEVTMLFNRSFYR